MDTQQNRKNEWPRLVRNFIMTAALLFAALPAKAEDYVLAYVNGGTTYYLARNGTTGVQRVNSFNPTTCIWSCSSDEGGNTSGTLNNSNTYGYLFQTVGGTKYFLGAANDNLSLATNVPSNYYRWRTNGTYVYNRSGNYGNYTNYYINLANNTPARNTTANTTSNARPYTFTISDIETTSSNPTINGADLLTATGNSTYTATGASYSAGYTNYRFNNTDHFVYNNAVITPAAATLTNTWSLTGNTYATVNNAGVVTVSSLPESDITLTLTVTVAATGGTPAAPGGTTLTATKEITIQGITPAAPTITRTGNTVSIATTSAGVTIYYTTDGSTPTASSTLYTGPFDLTTSPTTVKAIAIRDGHGSTVASETLQMQLAAPVITISNTGLATITAEAGATIHYTTDGSTPTTGSPTYSAPVQLTNPQTIMAIAVKANYTTSSVAMDDYINGGVSGGKGILDDREDHAWSYYSDPDCPIRSLNPADVKITYYGNGTGTVQTNNNDNPTEWNANATTVKVGIDADANTFTYFETLERVNGRGAASASAANGRCAYTTIANPFSVRPTYDSDGTSKYRGFYAWRVKKLSGGTIHSAATAGTSYAVGSTINAETDIYFAPSSEYGMEVEFEALWARAYVSTTGAPNNNLGVERNFYVFTTSANSNIAAGNSPCTYTSIYPNGTTDGTTAATNVTVYKYGNFTAATDSKIEYIILRNNNSTVNANGKNFTIGRGVSGYNGGLCATNLYGLNGNNTTSFRFNFASGRFTNLYFCGDGRTMSAGVLTSVIGCDYDRAMDDNSKLKITDDIIAGHNGAGGSNNNEGNDFLRCTVKSGDFDLGNYGGSVQFYLSLWGSTGSGTYGKKTMVIEGGVFSDISGGIDVNDNQVAAADMLEIRMKGGTVKGALYGAAQYAASYGNRYIIITGGNLKGWVAGGANGTQTTGGKLTGDTYVYFGGNARCDSEGSNTTMGSGNATGGNIFGAGSGNSEAEAGATVGEVNNSTVVIADECYVERNVYGGGNYGYVCAGTGHKSDIHVMGGTVDGSVFGGSNNQNGQIVNIYVTEGQVNSGVYGGSNTTGTVAGPISIQVNGGTVGDGTDGDGIFGGGYGASTIVTGNVSVTLGASTTATDSATVNGNVYGGSALGRTNNGSATNTTTVTMNKALVNGNLFGGAYGNGANVNGRITVNVNGGRVNGNVFGGGDAAAYNKSGQNYPVVNMTGGQVTNVFGGGKGSTAVVTGNPQVILSGTAHVTGNVYGGGDAAEVRGHTNVELRD